ncbi:MAG: TRAP transporter small permease [Vibrio sp.]
MKSIFNMLLHLWENGALAVDQVLKLCACLLLMAMMLLTCIDVIGRYIFERPVTGSVELTELFLGGLIFTTMPLITWRKEHICVDLADSMLPAYVKRIRNIGFDIVVALSLFVIGQKVWELSDRALRYGEVTEYLEIPTHYFVYFLAISCWLTATTSVVLVTTRIYKKEYHNQRD